MLDFLCKSLKMTCKLIGCRMFERGDGEAGLVQCQLLLNSPTDLVRCGDVYSLMIEQATKVGDWKLAAQLAQQLKRVQPQDNLALYIPKGTTVKYLLAQKYDHFVAIFASNKSL